MVKHALLARTAALALAGALAGPLAGCSQAQLASSPGAAAPDVLMAQDTTGSPAERAAAMLAQMTRHEKLLLVKGYFGADFAPNGFEAPEDARFGSAGYVPGIARLGIPPQWETDAGIGVATQGGSPEKRPRTALPSGIATAASWDRELAFAGGSMIGAEARADGFNVLLGGSVNLQREPRNGRNFEYAGEDPLLAGTMVGAHIRGVQTNQIISTIKHYALNDQETDRGTGNSVIEEAAMRMSDLLAFQFALEGGDPGAAMCAYNKVNGTYACENAFLLTQVLRDEWNWPGYVMSDWGAVHSTANSANAGLDQESGLGLQMDDHFGQPLLQALGGGEVSAQRLDLMVGRILHSMFRNGLIDFPVSANNPIDFDGHRAISQQDAQAAIVLLKNENDVLPVARGAARIAVIGGHADKGVLSGGGSSQVYPDGQNAVPGLEPASWPGPVVYYPSSPLEELQKLLPDAQITYIDGADLDAAAALAGSADLALVFANQWSSESIDVSLTLPDNQDLLIETVANANPKTAVILQTSGPVLMPWVDDVPAIVEAWFPGRMGGAAIANVLTGLVNPSGHLPATFPKSLGQLPYPGEPRKGDVVYSEGAAVGYKWFDSKGYEPLFPFGHGLSYTQFDHSGLEVEPRGNSVMARVRVTNSGQRAGSDAVQLYVSGSGWEAPRRLAAFAKVHLAAGESKVVELNMDPRLLALWDMANPGWSRQAGTYHFTIGESSRELGQSVALDMPANHLPPKWKP